MWLNDGLGSFTDSGQNLYNYQSTAVELVDLDGDTDLTPSLPITTKAIRCG